MGYKWLIGMLAAVSLVWAASLQAQTVVEPLASQQGYGAGGYSQGYDSPDYDGSQGMQSRTFETQRYGQRSYTSPYYEWTEDRQRERSERRDLDDRSLRTVPEDRRDRDEWRGMDRRYYEREPGRRDYDRGLDRDWRGMEGRYRSDADDRSYYNVSPYGGWGTDEEYREGLGKDYDAGRYGDQWLGGARQRLNQRYYDRGDYDDRGFGMEPYNQSDFYRDRQVQPGLGEERLGDQGFDSRFGTPDRGQQFGEEQRERSGGQLQQQQSPGTGTQQGRMGSSGTTGRSGSSAAGGRTSGGGSSGGGRSGGGGSR